MAAQRPTPKMNELPMKGFVDFPREVQVRRGPQMRVLARYMPVVPDETPTVRHPRITESIVERST